MKTRLIISLFLLAAFCAVPVFAQEQSVIKNQCQMLVKEDFVGEKINVHVIDVKLREILDYFTEQFDCEFIVTEKIAKIRLTLRSRDIPWNVALKSMLESKNLDLKQVNSDESKTLFRIEKAEDFSEIEDSSDFVEENSQLPKKEIANLPLYTETIKVEKLSPKSFMQLICYIERRISERGKIEVNKYSQTFTITDVFENLDYIKKLVELVDNEDFL